MSFGFIGGAIGTVGGGLAAAGGGGLGGLLSTIGGGVGLAGSLGAFGGGADVQKIPLSSADVEQRGLLAQLSHFARRGETSPVGGGALGFTTQGQALPSTFAPADFLQTGGIEQLSQLSGLLPQANQLLGQGRGAIGQQLDLQGNLQGFQDAFRPIAADIAGQFGALDSARSSGLGTALGKGFAQNIFPFAIDQQNRALSQIPQFAQAPLNLQTQAGQGLIGAGTLQRDIEGQRLLDLNRQEGERQTLADLPALQRIQLGLQASGIPIQGQNLLASPSTGANLATTFSNPGTLSFLGNLGNSFGGGGTGFEGFNTFNNPQAVFGAP